MPAAGVALSNAKTAPIFLSEADIAQFKECGFAYIADICTESERDILRHSLSRFFSERVGQKEGTYYDMLEHNSKELATLPTIVNPSNYAPELRDLPCRQRAAAIAQRLLGDAAVLSFEHAILKPALYGAPTPWHQDEAYRRDPGFRYEQVSFWIPLEDATVESGCLHYVAGSNLGEVLPHRPHNNNSRTYALECVSPIAPGRGNPLPVRAGDCAIHSGRTLHYAGPNQTHHPRYAYILEFEVPPRPLTQPREFSWHQDRQPPNHAVRARWLRRGGILIEVVRRLRGGTLLIPGRLRFEWHRCLRAFRSYFF
jgi:ectoine hydroxylase-related dioxygenase (phytanoyl-CoA dioxygenase family)